MINLKLNLKALSVFILFIAQSLFIRAQAPIWSNDFSNASDWTMNAPNLQGQWQIVTTTPSDVSQYIGEMASTTASNGFGVFNGIQYLLESNVNRQYATLTYNGVLDFSAYTELMFSFEQRYRRFNYDETWVEFSQDGGATWTAFRVNTATAINGPIIQERLTLDVSAAVGGVSTVRLRFRWTNPSDDNQYGSGYAWIVDDASFRLKDTEDPEITCPVTDLTVSTDADECHYTHAGTGWDATATDNDGVPSLAYELTGATIGTGGSLDGVVFSPGETIVTWTATDDAGNTGVCSFSVTVADNEDPEVNGVGDQTVDTDNDACTYTHSGTEWDATATDNCVVGSMAYELTGATTGTGGSLDGVMFNPGETIVTWTATDGAGNTSVRSFSVTVADKTAPEVLTQNVIVALGADGQAIITPESIDNGSNDACGAVVLALDQTTFTATNLGINTVVLTATDQSGNENSNTATVVVVAFGNATSGYDGVAKSLLLEGELPSGVTVNYTGNGQTDVNVYEVTAAISGGVDYNDLELKATLTITRATPVISWAAPAGIEYGTELGPEQLAASTNVPGTFAYSPAAGTLVTAGEHTLSVIFTPHDTDNYSAATANVQLMVAKAQSVITADEVQRHLHDGTVKAVQAVLNHDEATLTYTPQREYTEVGTYTIQVSVAPTANYQAGSKTVTLIIDPVAQQEFSLPNRTVTYNGELHRLQVSGLPEDAAVSYTINGEEGNGASDAGAYTVMAVVSIPNLANQTLTGTLTIERAPAFILGDANQAHTYDGTEKSLLVELNHDEAPLSYNPSQSYTAAGAYTIRVSAPESLNYAGVSKLFTLRIHPITRTLAFPSIESKTYGDADFAAGATSSSGEPISYTSDNTAVAEITANGQVRIVGAGEATITATVPANGNYSNRPVATQTLTVARAQQTVTLTAPTQVNRDAGAVALTATASSGLPVTLTIDDTQVAALSGTTLDILRLGTVTITATQAGDGNYEAAQAVEVSVRVVDPASDFPVRVHQAVSPNGDGINEFLMVEGIRDYRENRVKVFNRNGTVVWEASGYDNDRIAFRGIGTGQLRLPAGTYFYVVEVRNDGGQWQHHQGYFVLRY